MKKVLAAGIAGKKTNIKAPMVDPKGTYTGVQKKTLGNMKCGGRMKKGGK